MTIDLRTELTAAYADVSLADPLDQVVRRGRRIRRARRARRVAPALVAAAAVVVGVTVVDGDQPVPSGPVELVAFSAPAFPLSFDRLPDGLTGPSLSLDPSFERVGPGAAHAGWSDPADPASGIGISVADEEPEDMGEELGGARIGEEEGTVHSQEVTGGAPFVTVVWERADDQWVTVGGEGRFASEQAVVELARQVVDRGIAVPLQVTLAPRGWVLVAYKDDRIVTVADPAGPPATEAASRTLTVYLPQPPSDPADLSQEVTGGQAAAVEPAVHGRPAYLLPTGEGGWFLQATMTDGTVFVLQTPGDLTQEQVVAVAEGVGRG